MSTSCNLIFIIQLGVLVVVPQLIVFLCRLLQLIGTGAAKNVVLINIFQTAFWEKDDFSAPQPLKKILENIRRETTLLLIFSFTFIGTESKCRRA